VECRAYTGAHHRDHQPGRLRARVRCQRPVFFWGVTELGSAGPPDPEDIAALAAQHGLVFGNAPWLEDVIARYDLTPPPGRR
jgi:hypothetical protein